MQPQSRGFVKVGITVDSEPLKRHDRLAESKHLGGQFLRFLHPSDTKTQEADPFNPTFCSDGFGGGGGVVEDAEVDEVSGGVGQGLVEADFFRDGYEVLLGPGGYGHVDGLSH